MAKTTKKKNRKLKRQIRKTVGALLMVSAITVAAIPVQDVSANPTDNSAKPIKVAVVDDKITEAGYYFSKATSPYESNIPHASKSTDDNEKIVYTSGDGNYQFVYMDPSGSGMNKVAVILQYNGGYIKDNSLVIPDSLEAYRKFTDNVSARDFCLVSKDNKFLFYKALVQRKEYGDTGELLFTVRDIDDPAGEKGKKVVKATDLDPWPEWNDRAYVDQKTVTDPDTGVETTVDVPHRVDPIMDEQYLPCYYESRDRDDGWGHLRDTQLYYYDGDAPYDDLSKYKLAGGSSDKERIDAIVAYIGAEKVTGENGQWKLGGSIIDPKDGVFAGESNIVSLTMSENIRGISDYAFYDCTNLQSVTLNNGLEVIGNGAFAECTHMTVCAIDQFAKIKAIGKDAFYNCRAMTSFTAPNALQALGDNCFEGCSTLSTVDFSGSGKDGNTSLRKLGYHLFKGCSALTEIQFPLYYEEEDIDVDMFEGCASLQKIVVPAGNTKIKIGEFHTAGNGGGYPECYKKGEGWKNFKNTVWQSFYFEGADQSNIHESASEGSVAFRYAGQDLYEKIEYEKDAVLDNPPKIDPETGEEIKSAQVTYQVNSKNELVKFQINTYDENGQTKSYQPENITIPETIGPYNISSIGQGSFNDNCYLKRVTIPASVTSIGANAFRGCHNLETVIFTDATTITDIGADAFKTQDTTCKDPLYGDDDYTGEEPKLYFVGAMLKDDGTDTETFKYAMNGSSNINNNRQEKFWITCHSGWPTNLEVRYNYNDGTKTGEAQLVGYPRYETLQKNAEKWVESLPYVTSSNKDEYLRKVVNATKYYDGDTTVRPTEDETALVDSAVRLVIPSSVDSIKPGLFSGYSYDEKGEAVQVDENANLLKKDANGNLIRYDKAGNEVRADKSGQYELEKDSEGNDIPLVPVVNADDKIERILINGVDTIEPYTFKDCISLTGAEVIGSSEIQDYAFEDCTGLANVTLGTLLKDTGKRPFKGCDALMGVNCLEPSPFVYSNGILYRKTNNGLEIVECLENRGKTGGTGSYNVGPDELAGVTAIKDEAFAACDNLAQVDLSKTTVDIIPEGCFKDTQLNSVILPSTLKKILAESFQNGGAKRLVVYFKGDPMTIEEDAFKQTVPGKDQQEVIFQCTEKSNADYYAMDYVYINSSDDEVYQEFTVEFWNLPDYPAMTNMVRVDKQTVRAGEDAVPPEDPTCNDPNLKFTGWSQYTNIQRDTAVYAIYGSPKYTVVFYDRNGNQIGDPQFIEAGKSATPPTPPVVDGMVFDKWSQDYNNIYEDKTIVALYITPGEAGSHKVIFYDYDGLTVVSDQTVLHGHAAVEPKSPTRTGYVFRGWVPADFSVVEKDMNIVASYDPVSGSGNNPSASPGNSGGNSGSNNNGSKSSPSPSPSSSASPTSEPTPGVKKYTVSVSGGSGSGEYAAGEIVAVNAYYMGEGQVFDKWTSSTAGVGFSNPNATSATFTMPAANVAVTATYKTGSGSSSATSASSSGGGTNTVNTVSNNNGTVVDVTRPGISNTNLAGATVSGATDNFIVKVTEDQTATDAATAALQARYGDLSRIKYLPMDISLYDSTGRTKIADTSGISVNLTLPLPDDLIQYAGNNRVAAISGGELEDLNVRFTTVDGVPCVNFTATHFSPYVIYVDTANLSDAVIDATPKTGDPIHPKWFLAIGLACISLILFFKRDKVIINTRTA